MIIVNISPIDEVLPSYVKGGNGNDIVLIEMPVLTHTVALLFYDNSMCHVPECYDGSIRCGVRVR